MSSVQSDVPVPPACCQLTHATTSTAQTRTIYTEVISKICRYLLHPSVMDPIKECLQPFKREVSPDSAVIDCAPSPPTFLPS